MAYIITILIIFTSLNSLVSPASDLETCKKICQNVGVTFKSVPKPGPSGKPGPHGPPGRPASTSEQTRLKLEVNAKMTLLSELWKTTTLEMQTKYEERTEKLENALEEIQKQLTNTREALCPLRYKNKCFWAVLQNDLKFADSRSVCARVTGGRPANIYDEDHYHFLLKYLRTLVPKSQKFLFLWLGMNVNEQTGSVTLAGGGSPYFMKWRVNYPSASFGYTSLLIMARTDGISRNEGMYNQNPEYGKPGVLCEA